MSNIADLLQLVAEKAPLEGVQTTAIDGLTLVRHSYPISPVYALQRAALCIVVQGRKQVTLGGTTSVYTPSHYLIASVALPVVARVTMASPTQPYLCLRLTLDSIALAEMLLSSGLQPQTIDTAPASGLNLSKITPELTDAVSRMMRLLDSPADLRALAPLAKREVYYRLLTGALGQTVRQLATAGSRLHQISRVTTWIREHYADPLEIEQLAAIAGMSRSALHKHFKTVTQMSPLQYQKQLRLQEARKLMVANGLNASDASFQVGYSSATQFTREYSRMYGEAPARHAARLRFLDWTRQDGMQANAVQESIF